MVKTIHLIGIAGTGMGAFAGLLKQAGYNVQGSDLNTYPPMKDKLTEWQIPVMTPYAAKNLDSKPDLVIVGNVVSKDNEEVQAIHQNKLTYASFPQALSDLFLQHKTPLVVAGTHGKTTSSALLAHTLFAADRDPGFLIGGILQNFGESFRVGGNSKTTPFVVEGDEYDTAYFDKGPKFLHYRPHLLLATSLEYDHADIYQNVEQIKERFTQLFELVPADGAIIVCADYPHLMQSLDKAKVASTLFTYGKNGQYQAINSREDEAGIYFDVYDGTQNLGSLFVPLSGEHNVQNALGCYLLLRQFGLSHNEIQHGFSTFKSVKRRMEVIGEVDGITVVDDFAHHPTAVATTIAGAKRRYPGRSLWALFEPRSATSCRKVFQQDYVESFSDSDRVFLAPTGRQLDPEVMLDVNQLSADINKKGIPCIATQTIDEIVDAVKRDVPKNAVLLCMSNGGFGGIHQKLLKALRDRL